MLLTPTVDREQIELTFPNLAEWIDRYLQSCRLESAKAVTLIHYNNALKRFLTWYETEVPDRRISPDRAQEFRYWLAHKKQKYDDHPGRPTETDSLSPVTVKRTVGVVRTFFRWLHAKNYLSYNLAHWFPLPKGTMVTNRAIEPETLEALFRGAAMGEMPVRDVAIIALLADTGLRRKELVTTTVYKIRWLEGGLTYIHDVEGKADKLRDVPFSPPVHEVLKAWLEERETYALPNEPWLFIQATGQPLTPVGLYQILRRAAIRSGVQDKVWNTHSLRHAFATNFWRVHRDTKALSLILGHSSQKVTEDIYVHPVPMDLIEAHTSVLADLSVRMPVVTRSVRPQPPTEKELRQAIVEDPVWRNLGRKFNRSDVWVRKLAIRYGLLDLFHEERKKLLRI